LVKQKSSAVTGGVFLFIVLCAFDTSHAEAFDLFFDAINNLKLKTLFNNRVFNW